MKANPDWKWLNLVSFFEALRPDDQIDKVYYFTALVEPERTRSSKRDRQKIYFRALESNPKIEIVYGRYRLRNVRCGATCRERYQTPEEKKTDVNIAIRIIDDALNDRVDRIIVVSGDSDLEPAVEYVRRNFPKVKVSVYVPQLPSNRTRRDNRHYSQLGATVKLLPLGEILNHQLPDPITHANGQTLNRPTEWR